MLHCLTQNRLFFSVLSLALAAFVISPRPVSGQTAHEKRAYDFVQSVVSDGATRRYRVHVPASYDPKKPLPLILVFHGLHMTGQLMIPLTRFDVLADRKNFIAVFPDALNQRWEMSSTGGGDDVRFVYDLISHLCKTVAIDKRRVYAAGMSNGGYFTERLACDMPDQLAGIAIVGASMMDSVANRCAATRKIPAIFFIGTDDPLVPQEDGDHNSSLGKLGEAVGLGGLESLSVGTAKMGGLMSGQEAVDFWCRHNQCSLSPYTTIEPDKDPHDGTRTTRFTYGAYNSEVIFYSIKGGGHTWPGAFWSGPRDLLGRTSGDIDATELIVDFFLKHSN